MDPEYIWIFAFSLWDPCGQVTKAETFGGKGMTDVLLTGRSKY
jgi:hypothetical protein